MMNMEHMFICNNCNSKYYGKNREVCKCGEKLEYKGLVFVDDSGISDMTNDLVNWFKKEKKEDEPEVKQVDIEDTKSEVVDTIVNKEKIEEINTEEPTHIQIPLSNIEITDLLGNAKVTNAQMVPAIKEAALEKSKEKLLLLKNEYPKIYESSLKYIGKKNMKIIEELI